MADSAEKAQVAPTVSDEFAGVVSRQDGRIVVDLSSLPTDEPVEIVTSNSVQLRAPAKEQDNDPNVIASSVDKQALKIGDVLGTDFDLPEGLKRLSGWLVYNITEAGVPQALEPKESALQGVVNWGTADNHVKETLKKQGHTNARLWTENDGTAIFNNVVKGGHNDKAQLDVSGSNPVGRYWEGPETRHHPVHAVVRYPDDGGRDWIRKDDAARVRGVQDVPELSR